MSAGLYACISVACPAVFSHPGHESDCPTHRGHCAHLMGAGWRPVYSRLELDKPGAHRVHVLTQGAWLCPTCVAKYVPAQQRSLW